MIRSLTRTKKPRTRSSAISPKIRGKIIRDVNHLGSFEGSWHKVKFSIYRGDNCVHLLVKEGRQWKPYQMSYVWDALILVEERARHARPIDAPTPTN